MTEEGISSINSHKDRVVNRSIVFVDKNPLEGNHISGVQKGCKNNLLEFRNPEREASRFVMGSTAPGSNDL